MATIAPSVLAADFGRLADDIRSVEQTGVDMLHLDIMDGHFVPNISFGPGIVKTIDRLTDLSLDVHLMLTEPEKYFEAFAKAGADNITFHLEIHPDPAPLAAQLRNMGIKAGISLNPDMPIEHILPHLEHFDYLLVMSVFPGFGGQAFMPESLPKIEAARRHVDSHALNCRIEVDGGVGPDNARQVIEAGADILVMGTAFFTCDDRAALVRKVTTISEEVGRLHT